MVKKFRLFEKITKNNVELSDVTEVIYAVDSKNEQGKDIIRSIKMPLIKGEKSCYISKSGALVLLIDGSENLLVKDITKKDIKKIVAEKELEKEEKKSKNKKDKKKNKKKKSSRIK